MHINEWIKKYSPLNEIYRACDVANMLGMAPNRLTYRFKIGEVMADQKKPKLVKVVNNG
jgi:hypothetical protein